MHYICYSIFRNQIFEIFKKLFLILAKRKNKRKIKWMPL